MWSHDVEDVDDARGLRKEDGDATTPRMSLRQRRRRSRHRALLFLGTCVALAVAFAMLRSGVREHRGARDRVDGGVDGDYEAHAGDPFEERASPETRDGALPGADPDSTVPTRASAEGDASTARPESGASSGSATRAEAIRASMRRGAVVKQHREAGDGDEDQADGETRTAGASALGALFRFFGGGGNADAATASATRDFARRRRKARLHVTRDPSTGHLTMNDVGVGAFAVSQPRACAPIASEADGEANSVAGAMMALRTFFRVGKILRRCDAVSATAFVWGAAKKSERSDRRLDEDEGPHNTVEGGSDIEGESLLPDEGSAEALLRKLNAGMTFGPVCYTPDFLRGVASTLSVCSRNHEDGVVLALLGFAGFATKNRNPVGRVLVSVSDAPANAPERGGSAYLVHNHFFRAAFVDKSAASASARRAHFRHRDVPTTHVQTETAYDEHASTRGGSVAAFVRGRVVPATIGAEIRAALAALDDDGSDGKDGKDGRVSIERSPAEDATTTTKRRASARRVEIDLLTLDVARDGLYLVQPALETVSPRVVVASYDSAFGPERAVAAKPSAEVFSSLSREDELSGEPGEPGEPDRGEPETARERAFGAYRREGSRGPSVARRANDHSAFAETDETERDLAVTASLSAFSRSLERWGFHFVGCEAAGETAFFLRSDVIEAAHRAGRGSVHVTTPEDSGCFSARGPRLAMRRWPEIEAARVAEDGDAAFVEIDEAWLEAHAPGPPWRTDDAFLSNGAEEL